MTTVSLKLVGNTNDIIIHSDEDFITMSDIFNYLMNKGLSFDEISKIMFVNNGNNITNDMENTFTGTDDEPLVINMFTPYSDVKAEIIKCIYSSDNKSDNKSDDNNSDINQNDYHDDISQEEITKNNLKTIELFSDKDFSYLLNICLNKPELLNKVSNYITNGNISFKVKEINKEDFKYKKEYPELLELLNKLNINIDNEIFGMSILQHFEGNLNLSLRYILNKN